MPFYFFAPTVIILIPAVIFSIYANSKIRSTYKKYKQIRSRSGLTGRDVAELILNNNGIHDVEIESITRITGTQYIILVIQVVISYVFYFKTGKMLLEFDKSNSYMN